MVGALCSIQLGDYLHRARLSVVDRGARESNHASTSTRSLSESKTKSELDTLCWHKTTPVASLQWMEKGGIAPRPLVPREHPWRRHRQHDVLIHFNFFSTQQRHAEDPQPPYIDPCSPHHTESPTYYSNNPPTPIFHLLQLPRQRPGHVFLPPKAPDGLFS